MLHHLFHHVLYQLVQVTRIILNFGSCHQPSHTSIRPVTLICLLISQILMAHCCNDRFADFCDNAELHIAEDHSPFLYQTQGSTNVTQIRNRRSVEPFRRNERRMSAQISSILDKLFNNGYDRQIRPQLGQQPLEVTLNLVIRSMGPVDEQEQTLSLDCYFRQYWRDNRLRYNSTRLRELPMNWQFLYKIWRPDTYIVNGKRSYLHKITVPNRFIRIAPDGMISYSQRLTVKARCQMDLHKFPLDAQRCPLEIGSFGHEAQDIIYKWKATPLSMDKLGLAQYHLVNWSYDQFVGKKFNSIRNVSTVSLSFDFQRQQGFFVLQIYIPLTLIVMCSWVTFWLTKTEKGSEIPARTSLGASSVLSVVTIGFGGKSKPQVAYATALDVFIILCFTNVFAALVEFAFINFLDTLVRRLKRKDNESKLVLLMAQHEVMGGRMPELPKRQESLIDADGILTDDDLITPPESSSEPAENEENRDNREGVARFNNGNPGQGIPMNTMAAATATVATAPMASHYRRHGAISGSTRRGRRMSSGLQFQIEDDDDDDVGDFMSRCADSCIAVLSYFNCCRSIRQMEVYRKPHVVFYQVDQCCRKLFPLTFLLLNVFYWTGYMYLF